MSLLILKNIYKNKEIKEYLKVNIEKLERMCKNKFKYWDNRIKYMSILIVINNIRLLNNLQNVSNDKNNQETNHHNNKIIIHK